MSCTDYEISYRRPIALILQREFLSYGIQNILIDFKHMVESLFRSWCLRIMFSHGKNDIFRITSYTYHAWDTSTSCFKTRFRVFDKLFDGLLLSIIKFMKILFYK